MGPYLLIVKKIAYFTRWQQRSDLYHFQILWQWERHFYLWRYSLCEGDGYAPRYRPPFFKALGNNIDLRPPFFKVLEKNIDFRYLREKVNLNPFSAQTSTLDPTFRRPSALESAGPREPTYHLHWRSLVNMEFGTQRWAYLDAIHKPGATHTLRVCRAQPPRMP